MQVFCIIYVEIQKLMTTIRKKLTFMRVLLTGAGGNIGIEVVKKLVAHPDYELILLDLDTKKTRKRLRPFQKKATIIYGDINDPNLLEKALDSCDAVIHTAAIIPPKADQNPELTRTVNYFGTATLIETLKKVCPKAFFLYTSSVSVYGDRTDNYWISVDDPLNPSEGDYYALTKIETEQLIRESNIRYSIFRLTGIMGRPETDPLMFHMPLSTKMEIATTWDTANALVKALEHQDKLIGKTFNLGGGEGCRTTYYDFLVHMFDLYGLNSKQLKTFAFAEKNFHCGYFTDSDKLENILHFRTTDLTQYYEHIKRETNPVVRIFTCLFSRPILYFLTQKSEPLQAKKKQNWNLIKRFFK